MTFHGLKWLYLAFPQKLVKVRGSRRKFEVGLRSGNNVSQNTSKTTPEDDLDTFCDIISHLTSKYIIPRSYWDNYVWLFLINFSFMEGTATRAPMIWATGASTIRHSPPTTAIWWASREFPPCAASYSGMADRLEKRSLTFLHWNGKNKTLKLKIFFSVFRKIREASGKTLITLEVLKFKQRFFLIKAEITSFTNMKRFLNNSFLKKSYSTSNSFLPIFTNFHNIFSYF